MGIIIKSSMLSQCEAYQRDLPLVNVPRKGPHVCRPSVCLTVPELEQTSRGDSSGLSARSFHPFSGSQMPSSSHATFWGWDVKGKRVHGLYINVTPTILTCYLCCVCPSCGRIVTPENSPATFQLTSSPASGILEESGHPRRVLRVLRVLCVL